MGVWWGAIVNAKVRILCLIAVVELCFFRSGAAIAVRPAPFRQCSITANDMPPVSTFIHSPLSLLCEGCRL